MDRQRDVLEKLHGLDLLGVECRSFFRRGSGGMTSTNYNSRAQAVTTTHASHETEQEAPPVSLCPID